MNKIKYCIDELCIINELISFLPLSFFLRSLSRFAFIRLPDFITYSRQLNNLMKSNMDKSLYKSIKDDLNALNDVYLEFFENIRHKVGAHFSDIDFGNRLELWNSIDIVKIDFAIENPTEIYNKFSFLPDFISLQDNFIDSGLKKSLIQTADKLNIENYPHIGFDSLALSRHNSTAILNGSEIHQKAQLIKSLEVLLDFEFGIIKEAKNNVKIYNVFKEIMVLNFINYCDNLFTRNISVDAVQYAVGFDNLLN
ncbi:MAG: hypothetical protein JW982_05625, partial [Spirochaetes bacterium]|nr:hypothetical protein [Spirochaetota bacterium]